MSRQPVFASGGCLQIVLAEYCFDIPETLLEASRDELFARVPEVDGFRSGYLLGVEDRTAFPTSSELVQRLASGIEKAEGFAFDFSFLKGHCGEPPEAEEGVYFEGPHLDSHPALGEGTELLRVLVNLARTPRLFKYYETDSFELEGMGVAVGKTEFVPLDLPADIAAKVVKIPGRTENKLSALRFWASVVPHVGINRPEGSFLASFESPRPYPYFG